MKYINKNLSIEKIKVQDIAKKFGTPIYCYSYQQLKENIISFKKSFKSFSPLICFAIKSNTNVNLIREIRKFGLGADVVSMGELMIALKAGINPKKIVFSGVGKTSNEICPPIENFKPKRSPNSFSNTATMVSRHLLCLSHASKSLRSEREQARPMGETLSIPFRYSMNCESIVKRRKRREKRQKRKGHEKLKN